MGFGHCSFDPPGRRVIRIERGFHGAKQARAQNDSLVCTPREHESLQVLCGQQERMAMRGSDGCNNPSVRLVGERQRFRRLAATDQ
jgi:hypothetical protein